MLHKKSIHIMKTSIDIVDKLHARKSNKNSKESLELVSELAKCGIMDLTRLEK